MLKTFIERPVLSTVISILIVILGVLGLTVLPVTQYPDIAPPTVQVAASYPGANAQTVLESVSFDLNLVELDTYTFMSDYNLMNTESQISLYRDYNKRNSTYDAKHNANLIKLGVK